MFLIQPSQHSFKKPPRKEFQDECFIALATVSLCFPLQMAEIEKNKQQCGESSAIELPKYGQFKIKVIIVKIKALSLLAFPGKIRLLFAIFGLFSPGNWAGLQVKGLESNFVKIYFNLFPSQLPVKKFQFQHFPVLRLQITKDISEKF